MWGKDWKAFIRLYDRVYLTGSDNLRMLGNFYWRKMSKAKRTHKGEYLKHWFVAICFGKIGTFPEITEDWKKVTCKRCLKMKNKNI